MKLPSTFLAQAPFSFYSPTFIKSKNKTNKTLLSSPFWDLPTSSSWALQWCPALPPGGPQPPAPGLSSFVWQPLPVLLSWSHGGGGPRETWHGWDFPPRPGKESLRVCFCLFVFRFICLCFEGNDICSPYKYMLCFLPSPSFFYQNLFLKALPAWTLKKVPQISASLDNLGIVSFKMAHKYQLSLHNKQNKKCKLVDNNKILQISIWTQMMLMPWN